MKFNRLKLGFRNLSAQQTLDRCARTSQNLSQLPLEHLFQVPHEKLAALVAALHDSHLRIATLRSELKTEVSRRKSLLAACRDLTTGCVNLAAVNMKNDPVKMLTTGLPLHAEKSPVGLPAAPGNLRAAPTANEGEARLRWERPVRLCSFQVEAQAEPLHDDGWKRENTIFKQSCFAKGFSSGGKIWFRVRATNAHGQSPWSNLAPCRVK